MTTLHLDFETRSTVDLKKAGIHNYANHPTTDVWCAAFAVDDGPVRLWRPGDPLPDDLHRALADPAVAVAAHNASFEWHIVEYVCAPRYGWPGVDPARLDDTAARAAVQSLPRDLAGAAKALGLSVEKDDAGRRLMLQMMKPRKSEPCPACGGSGDAPDPAYACPQCEGHGTALVWWDVPEKRERLEAYCVRDVEVERELDRVLLPLSPRERDLWLLDFRINTRGVAVDTDMVNRADAVLRHSLGLYGRRLAALTDGAVRSVTDAGALLRWVQAQGVAVDSLDKENVTRLLRDDQVNDLPDAVRDVLRIRQEAGKSSTAKLKVFSVRVSSDGRMRDNLMYHGAGTGRWTARGVQLQNLPRPSIKPPDIALALDILADDRLSVADKVAQIEWLIGPVPTVIADCLRSMITAGPGRDLVVSDFANIEGRVNAFEAGQDDKVEVFRQDGPIYERMAAAIFNVPVSAIEKGSEERWLGKTAELGCGYGMGIDKFMATCEKNGQPIPRSLAEKTIPTYREVNGRIKQFWYGLEEAAIDAMRSPGVATEYRRIRFLLPTADMPGHGFLLMRLPSGRCLFYAQPELRPTKTPWGAVKEQLTYLGVDKRPGSPTYNKWTRLSTYGGKLVENAVQGIARDLLAAAMRRVEKAGYRIVLTVHDEIVAEVDRGFGSLAEFDRLMAKVPKWAKGCPVAVEGYRALRYRK